MKTLFKIITVSLMATMSFGSSAMAAGSASFSLSRSASSVTKGSSVTVSIYETGTDVNVVTAKVSYDASKLSCGGVGASSAFPNTISATCSGGSATISRYTNPGTVAASGSLVGSLTLTALSDTGSAVVSIASSSQIASNGQNVWDGVLASTSIALNPVPVVTTTPTPTPTPTPVSGGTQTAPKTTTATTTTSSSTPSTTVSQNTSTVTQAAATTPVTATTSTKKPVAVTETASAAPAVTLARRVILVDVLGGLAIVASLLYLARGYLSRFVKKPVIKPVAAATAIKTPVKKQTPKPAKKNPAPKKK